MEPGSRRPRIVPALAAFALSAALAFAVVRPSSPEAGDGKAPPLAVSGPVQLYGELVRDRDGLAVHVRAVNGAREAQRCRVTASVAEWRDSPMSRVARAPARLFSADVAVAVAGGEAAEERVPVPADVAGRVAPVAARNRPAQKARQDPQLLEATVTHGVLLQASCEARKAVG